MTDKATACLGLRPLQGALAVVMTVGSLMMLWKSRRDLPQNVKWAISWPFLGALVPITRAMITNTLLEFLDQEREKLGTMTFAGYVPFMKMVCTVDPVNIEHILKTRFDNYVKGDVVRIPFWDFVGDGIFGVDGSLWYSQRKTMARMLTKRQFEGKIFLTTQVNTEKVMEILEESPGPVDMFNLMNRFTMDTIGEIGLSWSINSLEDPESTFQLALDRVQKLIIRRYHTSPWWKALRALGLAWEPELQHHLQVLNSQVDKMVADLTKRIERGEGDSSFLGLFLADSSAMDMAMAELGCTKEEFLRDLVKNFLVAGRDTTAQCLSWTIYELAQTTETVDEARREIHEVCGPSALTYSHLGRLRYLHAVLDEGLRLHPSVPIDTKMCIERDVWPDGTIVPAGTAIQYFMYGQGRCKEIWGEDAGQFKPERFLQSPKPSPFAFTAFNAGPRECLGKKLAQMEMTYFLATFLRHFDFGLAVEPSAVRYDVQLTLGMNALPLHVRKRAQLVAVHGGA